MANLQTFSEYLTLDEEIWLPIHGWESHYHISNKLRIKSLLDGETLRRKEFILKIYMGNEKAPYPNIVFYRSNRRITIYMHRLVCMMFVENPHNKKMVNHKNGNKKDFSVQNLEWVTKQENSIHAYINKLSTVPTSGRGEDCKKSKITNDQAVLIKTMIKEGMKFYDISKKLNISRRIIAHIGAGESWKWLQI